MLGGFRLSREIACGGMATVYLAHKVGAHGIGQPAAIKVIHPHLAREREFVDMFLDEARIVSCINHPNVCRVLDFGKAEGTYYLAMEVVLGETWSDVLSAMKERPDAKAVIPAVLAQVMEQACEGLHAAHEARGLHGSALHIVHRDISPQNLIVGYDGSVRVLDFGIASAVEKLHTTRSGTIKGRFAYMAPEQMRGHAVDRRADIWSLGVVLWEGLTQQRMFKRETEAETVLAVTHDPLPSAHATAHAVPAALVRIATQALERDRDARYATARDMGLALARYSSSSLVPMGVPRVSMWMQQLFGANIDAKRDILREAANAAQTSARSASIPPAMLFEPKSPFVAERRLGVPSAAGAEPRDLLPSISTVRTRPRLRAKMKAWPLLVAVLSLAVTITLRARWHDDAPGEKPASTARNTAAESAAPSPAAPGLDLAVKGIEVTRRPAAPVAAGGAQRGRAPTVIQLPVAHRPATRDVSPTVIQLAVEPESARRAASRTVTQLEAVPVRARRDSSPSVTPREVPPLRARRDSAPKVKPREVAPAPAERAAPPSVTPRQPTRPPGPVARGTVSIVAHGGWADVYLGDKKLGTTPARYELPVGPHTLRLRPFGKGPELVRRVDVNATKAAKLTVSLD